MALVAAPANDRKRVKVYELKNNDWFDRGTGFCRGIVVSVCPSCCCPAAASPFCRVLMAPRFPNPRLTFSSTAGRSQNSCRVRRRPKPPITRDQDIKGRWLPEAAGYAHAAVRASTRGANRPRYPHCMDRAEWHRHGPQLPGA